MKNPFYILIVLILLAACDKAEEAIKYHFIQLNQTEVNLKSAESFLIETPRPEDLSFTCSNSFVASINNEGLVYTKRIGTAHIRVTNGYLDDEIRIIVTAHSNLYTEPIKDFSLTKSDIKAIEGEPFNETENSLSYQLDNPKSPLKTYVFDTDNKLFSPSVLVQKAERDERTVFLEERYKYHDGFNYYSDALIIEESTILVAVDNFDEEYDQVIYYPILFLNTPNKTGRVSKENQYQH
ncbi:MAG: hypothetical protein M0Q90_09195 [Bacteroidales bacterium]|nr:hypothetical protein [Bacteroidales bacterium]